MSQALQLSSTEGSQDRQLESYQSSESTPICASGLGVSAPITTETNTEERSNEITTDGVSRPRPVTPPPKPDEPADTASRHTTEHVDAITVVTNTEDPLRNANIVKGEGLTTLESASEKLGSRYTICSTGSGTNKPEGNGPVTEEESFEARIERLGRERPPQFKSLWAEIGFCFSISMSQILTEYFVSGFNVILPTIVEDLDIPAASYTWPANAFSLVVSSFLLAFGRLADMYGGYPVYVLGLAWLCVWSLIAGFSKNQYMIDVCRALQGLGPAAFLPSGLMLMGSIYRPGPRKNIVFSIYGAAAPLGFYAGIFFSGLTGQYTRWGWYFWIGTALVLTTLVVAILTIPSDGREQKGLGVKMDWPGAILIVSGLVLVVFAITDSSHAPGGWKSPYILVTLLLGTIILGAAVYVEGWVAEMPLLPAELFKVPRMKALLLALFLTYGSLGIFLFYATFYMENIMGASSLQVVAWFTPMALGGCIISTVGGFVLHIFPGTILVLIAGAAWIVAPLLFAIAPVGANFWAYTFPSMICGTIAIDITFNITNIFITTSLPRKQQGLAGALINTIFHSSIAFCLGIAEVVVSGTAYLGLRRSYKNVFWFEVACAAAALAILALFVKIEKAKSDMTEDEKMELAAEVEKGNQELPRL
ncbi:hypothetical protein FGG08_007494 [Glutinoglossum americanum]|uniref:Major facilitator superfamily (MFS) profile domain-containing protein n=1 Tax=Glutinoglossum americanum TaxID=1670608 RepID=A0A9P8I376_9PEZI|nr:hypothetical protein FGG08_007494 [Glutinoglossum americanum]